MLCFFFELGIDVELNGIMELVENVLIGMDFCDFLLLNDVIIDVDLMFNCVDCFSICGLVCEVGVLNCVDVIVFVVNVIVVIINDMILIDVKVLVVCLCYFGCIVKNVNV